MDATKKFRFEAAAFEAEPAAAAVAVVGAVSVAPEKATAVEQRVLGIAIAATATQGQ